MIEQEVQAERNTIINTFKGLIGVIDRESIALALTQVHDTEKAVITVADGKVKVRRVE